MTVIFSSGYTPYTPDSGFLLMETADRLLLETADKILLDFRTTSDLASTHARIAHSGNWFSGGVIDASSTAVGYFAAAPDNTLTYERWKPNTATTQTWAIDFGSSVACDYCCIGAHTLGTNGWTLEVQYLEDTTWTDLIPDTAITDDSDIFVIFPLVAFGSWRIRITGGTAPEIGVIKFGRALQMERPIFGGHTPIMMARQTVMKMNESESGEYLGRSKFRTYLQSSFSWRNLTSAWIRANWPLLQRSIETEPFFIAWRPESYSEAAFGRALASPAPTNNGQRDLMDVELSMMARGYD